jgi:WD40 repeat protein
MKIPMKGGRLLLALICLAVLPIPTAQSQTKHSPSRKAASGQSSKHSNVNNGGIPEGILSGHTEPITSLAFSSDGKLLAGSGGQHDTTVNVWSVQTRKLVWTLRTSGPVTSVGFSPDSKQLASGGYQITRLWGVQTGKLISAFEGGSSYIYALCFSLDGRRLATGSKQNTVCLWDLQTEQIIWRQTNGSTCTAEPLSFSPDGQLLVSGGCYADPMSVWDVASGKLKRTLKPSGPSTMCVLFTRGQPTLIVASQGVVQFFDTHSWAEKMRLSGFDSRIDSMALSSNGNTLVVEEKDAIKGTNDERLHRVSIWDLKSGRKLDVLATDPGTGFVGGFAFSSDGRMFASATGDGSVRLRSLSAVGPH